MLKQYDQTQNGGGSFLRSPGGSLLRSTGGSFKRSSGGCYSGISNKVRKGDVFFLMSSEGYEDIGKTAALAEDINDTYLNSFCKGYRITNKYCDPNFINYLMLSDNYRKLLIVEGKGFTRINLKMEKVTDFTVYLPPTKAEQTQIATYLDEKTQKIDAITSNIQKQIKTLAELRKTLINDVVTGKIKVTI